MDYLFGRAPLTESAMSIYERDMLQSFRKAPNAVQDDIVDFLNLKISKKEALR